MKLKNLIGIGLIGLSALLSSCEEYAATYQTNKAGVGITEYKPFFGSKKCLLQTGTTVISNADFMPYSPEDVVYFVNAQKIENLKDSIKCNEKNEYSVQVFHKKMSNPLEIAVEINE
jgi:hypothetical protein